MRTITFDRFRMNCLRSLFSFLFASHALQAQENVYPMNVLFIGNSYTHMNKMPDLVGKMAASKGYIVNVEMNAKSSHTFKMHSERPELFEHIKKKSWDYVVLQGFSRELSFEPEHIDTASIPYLNKIVDSIYANNPCTTILLYMTWGYKEGFPERPEIDTHEKMANSVRRGYQYISAIYDFPIVPVGDVFSLALKKTDLSLYEQDQQHPTFYGSYLIASTFYSAIFKTSPVNAYRKSLNEQTATKIQSLAYDYVMSNLDNYKLKKNTLKVRYERTSNGEYLVHCEANYPNACEVKWIFGDGKHSTKNSVTHKYKKPGTYFVVLEVDDVCGTRKIRRKVTFTAPPKPKPNSNSKPKVTNGGGRKI
jgi:hypothetical protein